MAYRKTEYTRKKTEATRSSLLLAAFELFLTRGYHRTSMQQVVKEAGTSIGNAYFYFQNKDDLLRGVIEQILECRKSIIDQFNARFPVGCQRLAVNLFCSGLPPLCGGIAAQQAIEAGSDYEMLKALVMAGVEGNIGLINECLPDLGSAEVAFAANAWAGAGTAVLVARVRGRVQGDASELALKMVNWQLRAIGLDEQSIAAGLSAVNELEQSKDWGIFIATLPRNMDNIDALIMPN